MSDINDDLVSNPCGENCPEVFSRICERRWSRRDLLKGGIALGATAMVGGLVACGRQQGQDTNLQITEHRVNTSAFSFIEIEHGMDENHHIAPDHQAEVLIRWGDPIFEGAPEFDPRRQSPARQSQQFGFNNDYIGYIALEPKQGEDERALLCVNHEYPGHGLMFPDFGKNARASITENQVNISKAASGNSIIEVWRRGEKWQLDKSSSYNRRITALDTEFELSGPVAGNPRLATSADPRARTVIGTINNCAGGITPWGTYLSCEENFNYYFSGELTAEHREAENHRRYNVPVDLFHWSKFDPRFRLGEEPNEANRFGWVVEIDPFDPESTPKKRTALGRFKHEGGENIIASDGRLVVYMGDDQRFEYLYKFVSRDQVNLENRAANMDLLDHGTLYVAKFHDDGGLEWLALTLDNEVLARSFKSQAEILIEPRRAADFLGATPLDRPEDVVPNAQTGKVYVMLTNNNLRTAADAANPREKNLFGHIIEITETDNNHAALQARWDMLVQCGDPAKPEQQAKWNPGISKHGWFTCPDNAVVDPSGRLWVSSDQAEKVLLSGTCDGLWALDTEAEARAAGHMFFRAPMGAEMTGPVFSNDGESLFLAVQHPGDQPASPGAARYATASTLWPDFKPGSPPRPAVMAIRRKGGGRIG